MLYIYMHLWLTIHIMFAHVSSIIVNYMLGCFSLERVLAAIGVQTLELPSCKTRPGASVTA